MLIKAILNKIVMSVITQTIERGRIKEQKVTRSENLNGGLIKMKAETLLLGIALIGGAIFTYYNSMSSNQKETYQQINEIRSTVYKIEGKVDAIEQFIKINYNNDKKRAYEFPR